MSDTRTLWFGLDCSCEILIRKLFLWVGRFRNDAVAGVGDGVDLGAKTYHLKLGVTTGNVT